MHLRMWNFLKAVGLKEALLDREAQLLEHHAFEKQWRCMRATSWPTMPEHAQTSCLSELVKGSLKGAEVSLPLRHSRVAWGGGPRGVRPTTACQGQR